MKVKGKLWWKYKWYSFCSNSHFDLNGYDKNCPACNSGSWINVWGNKISNIIYYLFPNLWRKWMNK